MALPKLHFGAHHGARKDTFAKVALPPGKGSFGGNHVAVHSPNRDAEVVLDTLKKKKREALIGDIHTFVGGVTGAESMSFYITKSDEVNGWRAAAKIGSVIHRYGGINLSYAARVSLTSSQRIVQAVEGASNLGAIASNSAIQGLRFATIPCSAIYGTTQVVGTFRGLYKMAYNAYADIKVRHSRHDFQALLKDYDLRDGNVEQAKQMQLLLDENHHLYTADAGIVAKSGKQLAYDRVAAGSELYIKSAVAAIAFTSVVPTPFIAGTVMPGFAFGIQATIGSLYGWRYGVQVAAMNNAAYAARRTHNPVCIAATRNMIDERVPLARNNAGRAIGYALAGITSAASYAVAATGVGVVALPVFGVASAAIMGGTHVAGTIYEFAHYRKTEQLRAMSIKEFSQTWKNMPVRGRGESRESYQAARREFMAKHCHGHKNMGWTEMAMLKMLRGTNRAERAEVVDYLENVGFSKETIARCQLANEAIALRTLATTLYSSRLKHNWRANRHLHESLAETAWIAAGIRNIKKLHERRVAWSQRTHAVK